jgi:hypothetical protein
MHNVGNSNYKSVTSHLRRFSVSQSANSKSHVSIDLSVSHFTHSKSHVYARLVSISRQARELINGADLYLSRVQLSR